MINKTALIYEVEVMPKRFFHSFTFKAKPLRINELYKKDFVTRKDRFCHAVIKQWFFGQIGLWL